MLSPMESARQLRQPNECQPLIPVLVRMPSVAGAADFVFAVQPPTQPLVA
jgi:hypothetical protein